MPLDVGELKRVEAASRALDRVPANAPAAALFDAIHPCLPTQAGLFTIIRPAATDALVSQPVRLPARSFEGWMRMPPDLLQMTLAPVVTSRAGRLFRDSETLRGARREQVEVLRTLRDDGLGEGAGCKLLERPTPSYGVEHIMLALLMGRGERVPKRSQAMLDVLHEPLRAAALRLALPLIAHQPIFEQTVAERSLGYICLSVDGSVREVNHRARHLVERYGKALGIVGARGAIGEFATRARERVQGGLPLQLRTDAPPSILYVDVHRLAKETHVLPEDIVLVEMREVLVPEDLSVLAPLTPREREIALLLIRTSGRQKEIANQRGISPHTVRTHAQNIFQKLGIKNRNELMLKVYR